MRFSKKGQLSETDLKALVFEKSNGIASAGQSIITNDFYKMLSSDSLFLKALRDFRNKLDAPAFHRLAEICDSLAKQNRQRKFRLKVNRIASALTTSVSAVPDEHAFGKVLQWLKARGLLGFEPGGNDSWFEDNQQLVSMLDGELSDIDGYDVWYRNIFPWWIYEEKVQKGDTFVPDAPKHAMKHFLNTILYGPPGTGKTYSVAIRVVAILENKSVEDVENEPYDEVHKRFLDYIEQHRVDFTTFHQSYGYEDFIEGIRPVLDDDSETVGYERHDGVFKAFCDAARRPTARATTDYGLNDTPTIWKVSLEGTGPNPTREDCLKNGYIRIGWDWYGEDLSPDALEKMTEGRSILKSFVEEMTIGDLVLSCWSNREIDAIGVVTGEYEWRDQFSYYRRLRKVRWLVKGIRENIVDLNGGKTLVQSTVYKLNRMQVSDVLAIVTKHTKGNADPSASKDGDPYVFVIDEINRGNISKIFGELITLIEPSKRLGAKEETKVFLPYSGIKFGVPPNVYILGTMNTADRSIALLDTALRRRFKFVEMMPRPKLLRDIHVAGDNGEDTDINLEQMLMAMNDRIEFLLDREHTIGHAYFMGDFKDKPTLSGLAGIFRNRIIPLLQEYFFDDYSKIRLVLGDNAKTDESTQFFVEKGPAGVFFGNAEDTVDADRRICRLNVAAFSNPSSYTAIYQAPTGHPAGGAEA